MVNVPRILIAACLLLSMWTMRAFAQTPTPEAAAKPAPAKPATAPGAGTATYPAQQEGERPSATGASRGGSKDSTTIDFEETLLEGKMKAPAGTFLQGRKDQYKNQMVQLRTNFRRELKRSKGGVRALTD